MPAWWATLLSALYDPVWISAIQGRADFGLALAAFGLLAYARMSPVAVVALAAAGGLDIARLTPTRVWSRPLEGAATAKRIRCHRKYPMATLSGR